MKLFEIFDTLTKPTKRNADSRMWAFQKKGNLKNIGSGSYARAFSSDSPKRLNQVTKVTHDRDEEFDDPYEAYAVGIRKFIEAGKQNPYLPRITDLKTFRTKNGKVHSVFMVEKLVDFMNERIYNEEFIIPTLEHMFHDFPKTADGIPDFIEMQLRKAIKGNTQNIKDPDLIEACKIIADIRDEGFGSFSTDTHVGNLMWRITGNRPQLVITDPLSSSEY